MGKKFPFQQKFERRSSSRGKWSCCSLGMGSACPNFHKQNLQAEGFPSGDSVGTPGQARKSLRGGEFRGSLELRKLRAALT